MSPSGPVPPAPNSLFRAEAVAELDAPRRLDTRLRVVSPQRWLALVVIALLAVGAVVWAVLGRAPTTVAGTGALLPPDGLVQVVAPTAGVVDAAPGVGDSDPDTAGITVTRTEPLLTLRLADGTVTAITSPVTGNLIAREPLAVGSTVAAGEVVAQVLPAGAESVGLLFVNQTAAAAISPGMPVRLNPITVPASVYGDLLGTVRRIDALPLDRSGLLQLAGGNADLAATMAGTGTYRVVVDLIPADTPSGLSWSSRNGPPFAIPPATALTGTVTIGEQAPIETLLGG